MNSFLNQHVLVLNRLWQAVNVCTARRALTLLFEGHAQVVLDDAAGAFHTFSFSQWRDLSDQQPHPETIATVSFKIRVPRVILLVMFDRLPKKEVKFTRHNIFERDRNTCQYCGKVFERKDLNLDQNSLFAIMFANMRKDLGETLGSDGDFRVWITTIKKAAGPSLF